MSDKISIITIRNPINRSEKDTVIAEYPIKCSLLELRDIHFPVEIPVTVVLNGRIISKEELELVIVRAGDQILFSPVIGFGGGSGKSILSAVFMVALAISAPYIIGALGAVAPSLGLITGTGTLTFAGAMAAGALVIVGGIIMSLVTPHNKPKLPSLDGELSQTYTWNPQTTQEPGGVIPKIYGKILVYGNIIASYIENINDKQYLNVLICLGLGKIKSLSDFKINDEPISNFSGITVETRLGDLNQTPISNFNDTKTEYPLSKKVIYENPVYYTTQGNEFQGLEVSVTFPSGLWHANDEGSFDNYSVSFSIEILNEDVENSSWTPIAQMAIDVQTITHIERWSAGYWVGSYDTVMVWEEVEAGSNNFDDHYEGEIYDSNNSQEYNYFITWHWFINDEVVITNQLVNYVTISSNDTKTIRRDYKAFNLAPGHYTIRVTNLTPDQTDIKYGDDLYLSTVREVYTDDFDYPRHVLVGIKALATDQLSGALRFSCIAEGCYVAAYDGAVWGTTYTNNPAWIIYDILTQPILGDNLEALEYENENPAKFNPDEWKAFADYCDELVLDGTGGTEKRVTFNGIFDVEASVWENALQVAQMARTTIARYGNKFIPIIDKIEQPTQLFNVSNMDVNTYDEVYLPLEDRAAELEGEYKDEEDDYKSKIISTYNVDAHNKNSRVKLKLFGVTKTTEAWRYLNYRLLQNQELLSVVNIKVPLDALAATVGNVVLLQHDCMTPRTTVGGRILSATSTSLTLDKIVTIEANKNYAVVVRLNTDAILSERAVINTPGDYTVINVATPFSPVPIQYDIYSFGESTKITKMYRITGISKSLEQFNLSLVTYSENVYTVDNDLPIIPPPDVYREGAKVFDLKCSETIERVGDTILNKVITVWSSNQDYKKAKIIITNTYNQQILIEETTIFKEYVFYGELLNQYEIKIAPYDWFGIQGEISTIYHTPSLQLEPPNDVTGLKYEISSDYVKLTWDANTDIDLSHYVINISHQNNEHVLLHRETKDNFVSFLIRKGTWTARVYAVDFLGIKSLVPAVTAIEITGAYSENVIATNSPSFEDGTVTNQLCITTDSPPKLRRPSLLGTTLNLPINNLLDEDLQNYVSGYANTLVSNLNYLGNWFSIMDFANESVWESDTYDIGSVLQGNFKYTISISRNIHDNMALWKVSASSLRGVKVSDFNDNQGIFSVSIKVSTNGTDWQEATAGYVEVRYYKVKISCLAKNPQLEYIINNFVMELDVPDINDSGSQSVTGTQTINYNKTFNHVNAVTAVASSLTCNVTNVTNTSFDVTVVGTKTINWIAQGY